MKKEIIMLGEDNEHVSRKSLDTFYGWSLIFPANSVSVKELFHHYWEGDIHYKNAMMNL